MDLNMQLQSFLQTKHRRRASTNETYRAILDQFIAHANRHPGNPSLAVPDFLSTKQLQPATHNLYLSVITTFLFDRQIISREDREELYRNRAVIAQRPYSDQALPQADVFSLFTYLRTRNARTNTLRQQRDLTIFCVQYACAMRISEVLTLTPEDITDQETAYFIRIRPEHSKTGVERTIPLMHNFVIGPAINASFELRAWLRIREAFTDQLHTSAVFYTLRKSTYGRAIDRDRMINKYNSIKKRLGIVAGRSTHALRHTRATELVEQGKPIHVVSEILGHHSHGKPNIATTALYIQRPKPEDIAKLL